jgi:type II secretory ATPase GspE/PulE/Tfp pilus assembly ATPase PilB-like protein
VSAPHVGQRRHVTAILVDAGVVTDAQVEAGLVRQRETGRRIGESLVEMGFVSEEDIGWALAHQLGITFVDVRGETLDHAMVESFPEQALRRLQCVPIVRSEDRLVVAAADPTDNDALRELEDLAGTRVECVSATPTAIARALDQVLGPRPARRPRAAAPDPDVRFDVVWDRSGETFLRFHLSLALRLGASEIHFVQAGGAVNVFHRVGARILPSPDESSEAMELLSGRLEALGMAVAGEDESHDCCSGAVEVDGRERPIHGSRLIGRDRTSITLRLLSGPGEHTRLDQLGLDPLDVARLRQLASEPSGLVLVCGPTGSGCSTTLAALLAEPPTDDRRWLVVAGDRRPWPTSPGLVDVLAGPPASRWREVAVAHGADGLVLDRGLQGRRVLGALGGATHGRWVLARTDWEDTFPLIEWIARHPRARVPLARRLRAVVQQRLVAVPPCTGAPAGRLGVFEVLFATDALRTAIRQGAAAEQLTALARADGFITLAERIREGVAAGRLDAENAARAMA